MKSEVKCTCLVLSLVLLVLAVSLPSSRANPVDTSESKDGRYIGAFLGLCNGEGKMCGTASPNKKDCCGALVCLLVPGQLGYYCMRDPTMPELYQGVFSDW